MAGRRFCASIATTMLALVFDARAAATQGPKVGSLIDAMNCRAAHAPVKYLKSPWVM